MPAHMHGSHVHYHLELDSTPIDLNHLVGHTVAITATGALFCSRCGRGVDKLFGDGFCYPCFRDAPEASECIVRPELCQAHLGLGRDPQWEEEHHNQPHAVYFAVTSAIKVGVTRETQIPTRWIDQGAEYAVQIARVPYRQLAGRIEVALKERFTDRTAWQRMLKHEVLADADLGAAYLEALTLLDAELSEYLLPPSHLEVFHIEYPVLEYPTKVSSINLAKQPRVEAVLRGVRGQYLIFEGGQVLNVRRHSGYEARVRA